MVEVAAESHRLRGTDDAVLMAYVAVTVGLPVVDAHHTLALERVMVMRDGVQQPPAGDLVSGLVRVDRHGDVVLLQKQRQMKARHAGADDRDAGHPLLLVGA